MFLIFLFVTTSAFGQNLLVEGQNVLGIQRGMSVDFLDAYKHEFEIKERSYNREDGVHKEYAFFYKQDLTKKIFDVFAECDQSGSCEVIKIVLRASEFMTKRGIQIGSTLQDVVLAYKQFKIEIIDQGIVLLPMKDQDVAFVLEATSLEPKEEYFFTDIPLATKISCIHIF